MKNSLAPFCCLWGHEAWIGLSSFRPRVGDHPAMCQALEMGAAFAPSQVPVVLLGKRAQERSFVLGWYINLLGSPASERL
jgi:hypothetical protein